MKKAMPLLSFVIVLLTACNTEQSKQAVTEPVSTDTTTVPVTGATDSVTLSAGDNSRNALDWPGTYIGTLPCADCEGIKTTITLKEDGNFTSEAEYLGRGKENKFQEKGTFTWDASGSIIRLKAGNREQQYKVGENQLFHLDQEGKEITGNMAELYILKKQ